MPHRGQRGVLLHVNVLTQVKHLGKTQYSDSQSAFPPNHTTPTILLNIHPINVKSISNGAEMAYLYISTTISRMIMMNAEADHMLSAYIRDRDWLELADYGLAADDSSHSPLSVKYWHGFVYCSTVTKLMHQKQSMLLHSTANRLL